MDYKYCKDVRDKLVTVCIEDLFRLMINGVSSEDAASQLREKYGCEIVFRAIIRIEDLCEL